MSILQRALNRIGLYSQKQLTAHISEAVKREISNVHVWLGETADAQRWALPDPTIFANQADLYRLNPILGTALDVLMDDVGLAKFNVKRVRGEETTDIPNHEFEIKLRNPNPLDSGLEFMRDTVANYKLNGNAVWWLNRENWYDKPQELWAIPFSMIQPVPDGNMYLSHYEYYPGNGKTSIPLPLWQIVHFKTYNPHNRFVGLSPIESLVVTLQGDLGMRSTKTKMYTEYGGAPQSILSFKDWVPDDVWNDVKKEKRDAAMRNEMLMLRGVGDGVSWMARTISSRDAEFIENLKHNMTDIFNRMCPGLLSMLSENSTEANALAGRATYSEKTLWKTMEAIAQKITSNVLPAYGLKLVGQFDDPRVVDRKLELEEQKIFAESHTIGEIRQEYYGDDPLGDERDKLLPSQINAQSGGIQEPPPNPFNQPDGKQPPQLEDGEDVIDAPAEEMPQMGNENESEDVTTKAAITDLLKWRKMALRGKLEKAQAFKSDYIPALVYKTITTRLPLISGNENIAALFDAQIERMKPKPKIDGGNILRGIELAVRALEAQTRKG